MTILVTGTAGFIGSTLVDQLLAKGLDVVGADNFDPYYAKELKLRNIASARKNKRFTFATADIRDGVAMKKLLKDVEAVFHLAAKAGVRNSLADPLGYHDVNVTGTLNLLELCRNSSVRKIIYASSSSVYGPTTRLPIGEDHPTAPLSPYGASKLAGEAYVHTYDRIHGLRGISLRFFTVYGPRQRPDEAICKFTTQLTHGEPITIYGTGAQTRDFTYVDDIVTGLIASWRSKSHGEAFNLGSGRRVALTDVINTLGTALGTRITKKAGPPAAGDVPDTWADITRAREAFGYEPKTAIEDGIPRFVSWWKQL